MKLAELKNMKPGDDIIHIRYGLCEVREVMWVWRGLWGVLVRPRTAEGEAFLCTIAEPVYRISWRHPSGN